MTDNDTVLMNTSWLVPAGSERAPADQSKLVNQYRRPLLIEEIRFASLEGIQAAGVFPAGSWPTDGFRMLRSQIKMVIGGRWLTRDFIPGDLFAPRPDGDGEIVIKLAEPLYLGATDVIHPTVRAPATQPVTVQFTLIGRPTAPRERGSPIKLPYWTSYTTPTVAIGATAAFKSTRAQISNQFKVPLHVKQFIGVQDTPPGNVPNFGAIRLRISDHEGNTIVRDPIDALELFQRRDRAWAVSTVLPPSGYYIFDSAINAVGLPASTSFRVSMFGYREETVP